MQEGWLNSVDSWKEKWESSELRILGTQIEFYLQIWWTPILHLKSATGMSVYTEESVQGMAIMFTVLLLVKFLCKCYLHRFDLWKCWVQLCLQIFWLPDLFVYFQERGMKVSNCNKNSSVFLCSFSGFPLICFDVFVVEWRRSGGCDVVMVTDSLIIRNNSLSIMTFLNMKPIFSEVR